MKPPKLSWSGFEPIILPGFSAAAAAGARGPIMRRRNIRLGGAALCLAAGLLGGHAFGQTAYGGYDLGPDYGAMVDQMLEQDRLLGQQIQQSEAQIVQQAMQNPVCQSAYQQHLAGGGQMPYPAFAYQCAATGGFTPEGMARFRASEATNQARERQALQGLREAEQGRAAAQGEYMEGYQQNQTEFGNVLTGKSSWVDPGTGGQVVLPYTQPNTPYRDPASGRTYVMDTLGTYHVQGPDGLWYPMAPWQRGQ